MIKNVFKLFLILCIVFVAKVSFAQVVIDSINVDPILCANDSVKFQIFATATSTIKYSVNNSAFQDTTTLYSLAPGTNSLVVVAMDSMLNVDDDTIYVSIPTPIIGNNSAFTDCMGISTICPNAIGGFWPYSYTLNSIPLSGCTNVSSGGYSLDISDANGCTTNDFINVPFFVPLQINQTVTTSCFAGTTICANAIGGTPPYSYNAIPSGGLFINGCFTVFSINNSAYTLTVTDVNGCIATSTTMVNTSSQSSVTINVTQPTCANPSNSICANVTGNSLYTYSIDSGAYTAANCFTNLSIGTHTILVKDSSGCISSYIETLATINSMSVLASKITDSSCAGGLSKAMVSYSGGMAPYSFSWNTSPIQSNDTAFNLPQGAYTCVVTDANGCISSSIVDFYGNNQWSVASTSICRNGNTNVLLINNLNNTVLTPLSISPNIGATFVSNFINVNPIATTIYTVTTSTANFCQSSSTFIVTVKNISNTINLVSTNPNCPNSLDGNIVVNVSPANPSLSFQFNSILSNSPIFNNLNPGIYSINIIDTSTNGCMYLMDTLVSQGINCGNIVGKVSLDVNNNCIDESNEPSITNQKIVLNPSGQFTFTNANGEYQFNGVSYGNYSVSNTANLVTFNPACANNILSSINSMSPIDTVNFLDTLSGNYDYYISGWGGCLNFPFLNVSKYIYYGNNISGSFSPVIIYGVFDSISSFTNSIPAHSSINGDTVFWNLNATNFGSIEIFFNVGSTIVQGVNFPLLVGYKSYSGIDVNTSNNQAQINAIICNSFDPNDKQVSPQGALAQGYIPVSDSVLNYNINFQNTGSAPAVNVDIIDTISNKMDVNSLTVITASHNYFIDIVGNVIKFRFPLIMLPDSNANEPASHGNIAYTLKMKPTAAAGDVINNTANIYFDYNTPIITNTTTNTIYDDLLQNSPVVNRNTSCNTSCGNGNIVMNAIGGVPPFVHVITPICNATAVVNNTISNLAAGNYTITTTDVIGNTSTLVISILNPVPIVLNLSNVQPVGSLGSASVAPSGGTPPYDYLWLPGSFTTASINNLPEGNYTVSVLDANGCSQGSSFALNYALTIPEVTLWEFVNCYPNPTKEVLLIVANFDLGKVVVFNASGQILIQQDCTNLQTTSIGLQSLAIGTYYVQMGKGLIRTIVKE